MTTILSVFYKPNKNPFALFQYLAKNNIEWDLDFSGMPEKQLSKWKYADNFWKLYFIIKRGSRIGLGTQIICPPQSEKKILFLVYKIFAYAKHKCKLINKTFEFIHTEEMTIVCFLNK